MQNLRSFLKDIYSSRKLLLNLAKNDIKSKYSGSFFGILWAFVQPLVTMLVFWFVFQVGFRNPPIENIPFIIWFACAYIPWIYFSDGLISSANCLFEYSYLVKKIRFRTSTLPLVKVYSVTFIHIFFMLFICIINLIYGFKISFVWLQMIYYSFCIFVLLIGLSWLISSISVFFKDFTQIINIILQIGFWITPIMWAPENLNENVLLILKLNPMYYISQGYRDTFITGIFFWERGWINLYFWIVATLILIVGALAYQKLRPHFADVL